MGRLVRHLLASDDPDALKRIILAQPVSDFRVYRNLVSSFQVIWIVKVRPVLGVTHLTVIPIYCCHKFEGTQLSKMSLHSVTLQF